ncbi:hypothetical protein [uncultured Martelella sp.]|uniref:hypothetical protein n=1 Tax=uncultured Martelella sp. TaxID=392331 RepID=UPI0029C70F80|nr:hypothetical protein [uncultured Martelella sp.]
MSCLQSFTAEEQRQRMAAKAVRARLMRAGRCTTVATLPAPEKPERRRLVFLQPPAEPAGSGGVYHASRRAVCPPDALESFLMERCAACGLDIAEIRSERQDAALRVWRRHLVFEMCQRFPDAAYTEIGRAFGRCGSAISTMMARIERRRAAGMELQPPARPQPAGQHAAAKARPGETMHAYMRRRARAMGFSPSALTARRGTADRVLAKHLIAWELRLNFPAASNPQIARVLGYGDHTTVLYALRRINALAAKGFPGLQHLLEGKRDD